MDLNIKIIDHVRKFPSLYDNKANLDERNQAWIQLAEKLKVHEIDLKIRWHSLLQEYQRNKDFIYANNMHFIKRNTGTCNKEDSWPEFIITEKDLEDDYRLEEEQEFVFLETNDNHQANDVPQRSVKERNCNNKEKSEHKNEIAKKVYKTAREATTQPTQIGKSSEITDVPNSLQHKTAEEITASKEVEDIRTITLEVDEQIVTVDANKNDQASNQLSKSAVIDKIETIPAERCEDVIFGELVTAMLKRMDEDKKRNIKKKIMNLLLS